jgi:hypothetical protein
MKKVIFMLSSFMVFMLSCQDIPDKDTLNLNSFEDMNKINKELIDFTTSNLSSFMSLGKNGEVWFDKNQLALASFDHLDGKLIDGSNLDFQSLAVPFKKVNLMISDEQSRSLNDDYGTFNMAQVTVADQFITNMLAVDDLSEVGRIVRNFNIQVLNSAFTQEEKDELLLLSSAALNLGDFFMNNGIDIINQQMVSAFGDPTSPTFGGRIQGCSVSTKSVWVSAVWGLTTGAVVGAYTGATAGTVASPIGTVTGAVSGAVVGGATGFVTASIGSVVTQLWETCWN